MAEDCKVVAFSGPIGAGKSGISKALADSLGWPRISFGDYVRDYALKNGRDAEDRGTLQALGQLLVLADAEGFVRDVLKTKQWTCGLVLDGLRHVEIRQALLQELKDSGAVLRLVYVDVDEDTRQERALNDKRIERRMLSAYDQDLTEAQVPRIVPAYADLRIDGTLPIPALVDRIIDKLQLKSLQPA